MAAPKTARTHPPHTSKAPPPQAFITLQLLASSPLLMASLLQPMSLLSAIFPNIQSSPQPPTPTQFLSLLPNSLRTYSTPSSLCACGNLKLFTLCAQKWAMWLFVYIYFEAASWVETVIKLSVFTHCTIPHPSPIWISFDFFLSFPFGNQIPLYVHPPPPPPPNKRDPVVIQVLLSAQWHVNGCHCPDLEVLSKRDSSLFCRAQICGYYSSQVPPKRSLCFTFSIERTKCTSRV